MPLGSAPGPGYRPDPSAASTDPQSNLVNLGPGKPLDMNDYAVPIRTMSREGDAFLQHGKYEQAAQKYNKASSLCVSAANAFAHVPDLHAAFLQRQSQLLAQAKAALNPRSALPPKAAPPERAASAPVPPPPTPSPAKQPLTSAGGLTEVFSPSVKTPSSAFAYETADYSKCVQYVAELARHAESIKEKEPQRAITLFTEAGELLEWWGVKRFNALGAEARSTMRQEGQKFATEAQRLRTGTGPAVAANIANGAGNTDLDEIERRARDCIVNDPPDKAVTWESVIGCDAAKNALLARLIDPYVLAQSDKEQKGTGVLLYGPSGTGKTMLVKAVVNLVQELRSEDPVAADADEAKGAEEAKPAKEAASATVKKNGITLIIASMADVNSKWVGEGEKFVRSLFDVARKESPSVIFIDEVDALFAQRTGDQNQAGRAVLNEFLIQSNDLNKNGSDVTLLAATNVPWLLDDAIRRRLSSQVEVPTPDPKTRAIILQQKLKKLDYPCSATDAEIEELAMSNAMSNFSGSNLETVATQAKACGPDRRRHEARFFVERDGLLWPCEESTPGSKPGNYLQLLRDHRREHSQTKIAFGRPSITLEDLKNACRGVPTADNQIALFAAYRKKVEAARQ